jgi:phage shock protein E
VTVLADVVSLLAEADHTIESVLRRRCLMTHATLITGHDAMTTEGRSMPAIRTGDCDRRTTNLSVRSNVAAVRSGSFRASWLPLLALIGLWVGMATPTRLALAAEPTKTAPKHTKDSLEDVKLEVEAGRATIIDVRELEEWDAGHLKQATRVSLSELQQPLSMEELRKRVPKDKVLYVHCRSGARCLKAAPLLEQAGFTVKPLKPGYETLRDAGFSVVEPKK